MSPTGHNITAAALGCASASYIFSKLNDPLGASLALAGAMLGARAPDWTEIARWKNGKRYSVIPHRGPTHWPGFWLFGAIYSALYIEAPYSFLITLFFASAVLHLILDWMTPSGIPLVHPFAKRKSLYIYRASDFIPELKISVMIWVVAGVIISINSGSLIQQISL